MRNIVKKIVLILFCVMLSACFVTYGTISAEAKSTTFTKNGLVYAMLGKDETGQRIASIIGIDENAGSDMIKNIKIYSVIRNNRKDYNIKGIESLSFAGCSGIESIEFEDGIESVGVSAFYKCEDLCSVIIPASLTDIGSHCFAGCTNLKNIVVSEENKKYTAEDGVLYSKKFKKIISAPAVSGDYTIKKGVETVGTGAFDSNTLLTGITFPSTIRKVEESAFYNCLNLTKADLKKTEYIGRESFAGSGLTEVTIPATTVTVKGNPFMFCDKLTKISVSKKNVKFKSSNGILLNASGEKIISASSATEETVIPSGVKVIGEFAFAGNTRINNLVLPAKIEKICEGAFCYCTSLKKVRFSSRKTNLDVAIDEKYGVFFNTVYNLIVEVPYSDKGFEKGSLEESIKVNSPAGVDITTY